MLSEAVVFMEALPLHNGRPAACAVFVDVDIAMEAGALVVLLKAEMVVVVSWRRTTATAAVAIAASRRTPSHALKSSAIPALTTSAARGCRRVVIAIQGSS